MPENKHIYSFRTPYYDFFLGTIQIFALQESPWLDISGFKTTETKKLTGFERKKLQVCGARPMAWDLGCSWN